MIDFLLPPEIPIFEPNRDPHDLKLRNIIHPWKGDKPGGRIDVGILGIPFDLGVKRSGGNPPASPLHTRGQETSCKHYSGFAIL
ncbi:MAG: hypothetical protein UY15_C0003G0039 [Parcubacteria group bacterium GW2011_GWA2_47_9]|nr:MAG: hypothetical protein UY15_C0003G0039 [Parcubacteria group bacterium GW2011_GWA2_47_9]